MRRNWIWTVLLGLPLAIAGGVYAASLSAGPEADSANSAGFVCPITGEELPCEKCCPLNN